MILRKGNTLFVIFFVVYISLSAAQEEEDLSANQRSHRALDLEAEQLTHLSNQFDAATFKHYLNEILIPRVPQSPGHKKVKEFIRDELQNLGWTVVLDSFRAKVPRPFNLLNFTNIIATPNPNANRYLILSAHYDSKWFEDNPNFVAATDSAVSCAMLLMIAKMLGSQVVSSEQSNLSIMLVFFDGEEAIREWTSTDSIYGARHLAKKWTNDKFLRRIDMLVLLDLIGAPDPKFYNFFEKTQPWFGRMIGIEHKLGDARLLSNTWQKPQYFQPYSLESFIEDDHVPFLRRGVPILHCITYPFPTVWHKPTDDASAIDYNSSYDLTKIFAVFVAEYLNINQGQGAYVSNSGVTFN